MFVYVLQCRDGRLYIGQTSDLEKRLERHNRNPSRQMKGRLPVKLIGYKEVESRAEAVRLEKQLKGFKDRQRVLKEFGL